MHIFCSFIPYPFYCFCYQPIIITPFLHHHITLMFFSHFCLLQNFCNCFISDVFIADLSVYNTLCELLQHTCFHCFNFDKFLISIICSLFCLLGNCILCNCYINFNVHIYFNKQWWGERRYCCQGIAPCPPLWPFWHLTMSTRKRSFSSIKCLYGWWYSIDLSLVLDREIF